MNYNQDRLILSNEDTGEVINASVVSKQYSGKQIKGLNNMNYVNFDEIMNIEEKLGFKKNSQKILRYIFDNLDQVNVFRANISMMSRELSIPSRKAIKDTFQELVTLGFMVPLEQSHYYQINPFIFAGKKLRKQKDALIFLQNEFIQKYSDPEFSKDLIYYPTDQTEYLLYLKSEDWFNKKQRIIEERKCCDFCGATKYLHIHHISYRNLFNENDEDLQLLCDTCHRKIHLTTRVLY
jgi:hypothetical protein